MNILMTGGAGYIGSHAAVVLSEAGHEIVLLDNFSNSCRSVLGRLQKILGKTPSSIEGDVRDTALVTKILQDYKIDGVIHFAGLKAVSESIEMPIDYYSNNVQGTISLLQAMSLANVKMLVFSSSATVYGDPQYLPIDESHPTSVTNPYGRSKLHIEEMLEDLVQSNQHWKIVSLRYFNPAGAHESGLIGEGPNGVPSNLMPCITQVALGSLPHLNIYGNDYPTPDGTGLRDYIHVMDLAEGHLAALSFIDKKVGLYTFNLATGRPCSVREMISTFEGVTGRPIPFEIKPRRAGDVANCYANASRAAADLNWKTIRTLESICASSWNFQKIYKCSDQC